MFPFCKIKSIHFARFVILNTQTDKYPIQLAFSSDFDGDTTTHINELIAKAGEGLKEIFSCCIGFTGDIKSYWAAHTVKTAAAYNGHIGASVSQIEQEDALRTVEENICITAVNYFTDAVIYSADAVIFFVDGAIY